MQFDAVARRRPPRVLVATANSWITEVQSELVANGVEVQRIDDWPRADALLTPAECDLLILDLHFGVRDNLETIRRLRAVGNTTCILALSESRAPSDIVAVLDAGADDWLRVPFHRSEFAAHVRALLRRCGASVSHAMSHARLKFDPRSQTAHVDGAPLDLSPREAGLLRLLLMNFNGVVTRERILDEFYGLGETAGANTIEVYVSRLRRKLNGSGLAVKAVRGRGYVIEEGHGDSLVERGAG